MDFRIKLGLDRGRRGLLLNYRSLRVDDENWGLGDDDWRGGGCGVDDQVAHVGVSRAAVVGEPTPHGPGVGAVFRHGRLGSREPVRQDVRRVVRVHHLRREKQRAERVRPHPVYQLAPAPAHWLPLGLPFIVIKVDSTTGMARKYKLWLKTCLLFQSSHRQLPVILWARYPK
jgi:hypothetical protein